MVILPADVKTVEALLQIVAHPKETAKHLDALKQENAKLAEQQAALSDKLRQVEELNAKLAESERRMVAAEAREKALEIDRAKHRSDVAAHQGAVAAHQAQIEAKWREQAALQDALEQRGATFRSQQLLADKAAKDLNDRERSLAAREAEHTDRVNRLRAAVR